jgi:hypothetical protein
MNNSIAALLVTGIVALSATPAIAQTYDISLLDGTSPAVDGTGSFSYSNGTISNFTLSWNGLMLNFTKEANELTTLGGCGGGAGAATFNFLTDKNHCDTSLPAWEGIAFLGNAGNTGFLLKPVLDLTSPGFEAFGDQSDGHGGIDTSVLSGSPIKTGVPSEGFIQSGRISVTAAPEIDPASATSALTLLFGSILVLRSRKRHG